MLARGRCGAPIWDYLGGGERRQSQLLSQEHAGEDLETALGIPLPFNRVVLFLITLLQITIICLGNYITPNQTMPHGELNTQRLLKGHTVKSSPPHIYILIYNGHQISLV